MSRFTLAAVLSIVALTACEAGPKSGSSSTGNPSAAPAVAAKTQLSPGAVAAVRDQPLAPSGGGAAPATGQSFGAGVKLTDSMPIATLLADPKAHVGQTVRVEGMIVDVCPKRGCWMDLAGTAPGQKVRFKVTDGEMVFPVDAKGKYAVAEGVVAVNELTLEETKEYVAYQHAEYGAEKTPESVTEPMVIVRLDGTGAMLRDKQ